MTLSNKLLSDLKEALVEFGFTQRWAEIEKWWTVGKLINESKVKSSEVPQIAEFLEIDVGDLWDAILFYKKFPDLDLLPFGKNISWIKIREEL